MADFRGKIPVSVYKRRIRIVISEHTVIYPSRPDILLHPCPACQDLSSGNHCPQHLFRTIDDRRLFRPGVNRVDVFPIDARQHYHLVPGKRHACRIVDMPVRPLPAPVSVHRCVDIHIVNCCFSHDFSPLFIEHCCGSVTQASKLRRIRCARSVFLFRTAVFLTARASAFFVPTSTSTFFALVTPV